MPVELLPTTREHEPILANLLELYIHDFSEQLAIPLGPDGRFGYPDLPAYWHEPGRHAFLVRDGALAGFVLVKRGSRIHDDPDVLDVAEFFIARAHRRRGLGTTVAHQLWTHLPGRWELRVRRSNPGALGFWAHAVATYIGSPVPATPFEANGQPWSLLRFTTPAESR